MPEGPLIVAERLTYRYQRALTSAVAGIDLEVAPSETVGIVGESGSGKTTVGRLLVGALHPTSGAVRIDGQEWAAIPRRSPLRKAVQMVFQDPYGSLNPAMTAHQTVAEVCRVVADLPRREARLKATSILEEVGLSGPLIHRRPRALSGGQCQRVGIARALACNPTVLVADEPTSSLDVSVQAQILNLLSNLRERRGLALVLISHDLAVISHMTSRAVVMYRGHVVESGPTKSLLTSPSHPYTRELVESLRDTEQPPRRSSNAPELTGGCVFSERCPRVAEDCLVEQPRLVEMGSGSYACLHPLAMGPALQAPTGTGG